MLLNRIFQYLSYLTIGIIFVYITPLLFSVPSWEIKEVFPLVILDSDYSDSLLRTLSFSILSTLGIIAVSFFLGYILKNIKHKKLLLWGSLLLLPFLLGSVSTSFLFKVLFLHSNILNLAFNNALILFFILGVIQFWQFGTLFTYIFWLNNLSIRETLKEYTDFYNFTSWEKIKHIFLPHQRNLVILLSIFCFVSNLYEVTKLQIIFRASKGTNSELISTTLYNAYLSNSRISPDFAINTLFSQVTIFYLPLFLISTLLLYIFISRAISFIIRPNTYFSFVNIRNTVKNRISVCSLIFLIITILLPILIIIIKQGLQVHNLSYLAKTVYLSLLASLILIIVFILPLSYYLRVKHKHKFYEINDSSLWIFILFFLLFLIPPLALMLFGFEWNNILGVKGAFSTNVIWVLGQCINSLPIIGSFIFVVHFIVRNKELYYLETMNANFLEIVHWSFLKRFRLEYFMTFLFSFSIIWNEGTFNKIYSDVIPSYVSEILRTVNSRNADYSQGMMFFLFSLFLGVICIILWNIILQRFFRPK